MAQHVDCEGCIREYNDPERMRERMHEQGRGRLQIRDGSPSMLAVDDIQALLGLSSNIREYVGENRELRAEVKQLKGHVSTLTMAVSSLLAGRGWRGANQALKYSEDNLATCGKAYREGGRIIPVATPVDKDSFKFGVRIDPPPPEESPKRKSAWERIAEDDD